MGIIPQEVGGGEQYFPTLQCAAANGFQVVNWMGKMGSRGGRGGRGGEGGRIGCEGAASSSSSHCSVLQPVDFR